MIVRLDSVLAAQRWCAEQRARGTSLGFVPTMGALHLGHLSLVERARSENQLVSASVFVNPLQFDDVRDLERYPRDFEADARLLESAGCAMVFQGTLAQFFPGSGGDPARLPWTEPGSAAEGLEGSLRPGHFRGVATIVRRLFEVVQPTAAYFGEKDFQQTLVVRELIARCGGPRLCVCPTSREPDGLARSSRNLRLDPQARVQALALSRALFAARSAWQQGQRDAQSLRESMLAELQDPQLRLEYAELRDPLDYRPGSPSGRLPRAQALVAAWVGGVRLIDTLRLDTDGQA